MITDHCSKNRNDFLFDVEAAAAAAVREKQREEKGMMEAKLKGSHSFSNKYVLPGITRVIEHNMMNSSLPFISSSSSKEDV